MALPMTVIMFSDGDWPKFYLVLTGDLVDFDYNEYLPKTPHPAGSSYSYRTVSKVQPKNPEQNASLQKKEAISAQNTTEEYGIEKKIFKQKKLNPIENKPSIRTVTEVKLSEVPKTLETQKKEPEKEVKKVEVKLVKDDRDDDDDLYGLQKVKFQKKKK